MVGDQDVVCTVLDERIGEPGDPFAHQQRRDVFTQGVGQFTGLTDQFQGDPAQLAPPLFGEHPHPFVTAEIGHAAGLGIG